MGGGLMIEKNRKLLNIDTPAILIDLDKLDSNIKAMATMVKGAGLKLKPHNKIHRSAYISELQLAAGAYGVSVSKIGEAVILFEAGIKNITIVHPFYGDHKLAKLKYLLVSKAEITCVVDSIEGATAISKMGMEIGMKVPILLKINTSVNRFGTLPDESAIDMVKNLIQIPGVEFDGILTHEGSWGETTAAGVDKVAFDSVSAMSKLTKMLRKEGIEVNNVVVGSTPTARASCLHAESFPEITEVQPGAYVLGDQIYINTFAMTEENCSASILVTVVSRPAPDRICIDGGFKTFSADPLLVFANRVGGLANWTPMYGTVKGHPDIIVERLTEEIGILTLTDPDKDINIGDRLEILPNHISLAVNLHDHMYGIRNGVLERKIAVVCRGVDY